MFQRKYYKGILLTLAVFSFLFLIKDFSPTRSFFTYRQSIKEFDFTVNSEEGQESPEVIRTALESGGEITGKANEEEGPGNETVPVTSIVVTGAGGLQIIDSPGGELQMSALVEPDEATDKSVTWSVVTLSIGDGPEGMEAAAISDTGVLTALHDGEVAVVATANDGSGQSGELMVIIFNQNGYEPDDQPDSFLESVDPADNLLFDQ